MKRLAILAIVALSLATPAIAQQANPPAVVGAGTPASPGPAIGVTPLGNPVIVTTPSPAENFNFSNVLASVWNWFWVAFGGVITTAASLWLVKLMKNLGIDTTKQQNELIDDMVKNALNDAAARAGVAATSLNLSVPVKNQIVQQAVEYVQQHGAETIKALGLDPQSGEAVSAIKAKMESVLVDPAKPTNAALQPGLTKDVPQVPPNANG